MSAGANAGYNSDYSSNAGEDDPIGYLKLDVQYIVNKAPEPAGNEASEIHNKIALISEIQIVIDRAKGMKEKVESDKDKDTIQQLINDLQTRQD